MSTVTPIIDHVEDLWPDGRARTDALDQLVLASHLLGANRAVSNFGGGNTSAKGTTTDHAGPRGQRDVGQGLGLAISRRWGRSTSPALRLDEVLPLMERDEMSDEDMVAYLARCQLDPAAPRASIETLLHAFVPAPHVHHTHPDGINVLAGTADGERLVHECFGDEAAWIPYIRPGLHAVQAGRRSGPRNPELKLVVLAKHGLIVLGRHRRGGVPAARSRSSTRRSRSSTSAQATSRASAGASSSRPARCSELLPAIRGAVSSERSKVLTVDTSDRVMEFVCSEQARAARDGRRARAPTTSSTPSGCRCGSRARTDAEPHRRARRRPTATTTARTSRPTRDGDEPGDPDAADRARRGHGHGRRRHDDEGGEDLARPLPPRDRGDGRRRGARRVRLARRRRELRDRVLAARALQARAGAAARRAAGQGRAGHRRRGRHRPRDPRHARLRGRVRRRVRPRRGRRARRGGRLRHDGLAVAGDVTSEDGGRRRVRRRGRARSAGVDIVVSNAGIASSAALEETTLERVEPQPRDPRHRLLPRRARGVQGPQAAGRRRLDRLHRVQERARRGQERRRVLARRRPPSCTSRAASPRRAAATASASTPSTPTPSCRARRSGARPGARSAPRPTTSTPRSSTSTTASATR